MELLHCARLLTDEPSVRLNDAQVEYRWIMANDRECLGPAFFVLNPLAKDLPNQATELMRNRRR